MAKRLTNTEKWDDDWFLSLPPRMKVAWEYLRDNCDGSGFKKISFSKLSSLVGEEVTREEFDRHIGDRVLWLSSDTLWLPGFIKEQYKTLSAKHIAHVNLAKKVLRLIGSTPLTKRAQTCVEFLNNFLANLSSDTSPAAARQPYGASTADIGYRIKDNNKKEDFFEILNSMKLHDLALREADKLKEIETILCHANAFGDSPPTLFKSTKTKFLATLACVYPSVNDFKTDLLSIINEPLAETKQGAARADYVQTRLKNKALELYNAAC